jgi:hypothetical protein
MNEQRIYARLAGLEVGQSVEFTTRVYTPIKPTPEQGAAAERIYGPLKHKDQLCVLDYVRGASYAAAGAGDDTVSGEHEEHERVEMMGLASALRTALHRVRSDRLRHTSRFYATQKIDRVFSGSLFDPMAGVWSTLSITVHRSA